MSNSLRPGRPSLTSDHVPLHRPDGEVAVDILGTGPLVVCVPGMGDLRSTYRHLVPGLVASGLRVAVMDLRGHGDSTTGFAEYGDAATAGDIVALVEQLGGPAVVVGNSMAAGSAVIAAAARPDLVAGLVLVGPFVRDGEVSWLRRTAWRIAMSGPWATRVWRAALPSLYQGDQPADLDGHLAAIADSLRRPGRARAFRRTTRTSHADAESALAAAAGRPSLVVMGEQDPDFPDPRAEARWIAARLGGEVLMVPRAGHYPQAQRPDLLVGPIVALSREALAGG